MTSCFTSPLTLPALWCEPAAPEHLAHFYEDDEQLLSVLGHFVIDGLAAGESAIVIATAGHEAMLRLRLASAGINVESAMESDSYIPLDAEDALSRFMVNGWPDGQLLANLLGRVMKRAVARGRRTRIFGEMVSLLWARGQTGATVRLEDLWNQFSRSYSFPLLCAYPINGFAKGALHSLEQICSAHARFIAGPAKARRCKTPVAVQAAD